MIEQRPTVQDDMPNSGRDKDDREGIVRRHPCMTSEGHLLHLQHVIRPTPVTGSPRPLKAASRATNAL